MAEQVKYTKPLCQGPLNLVLKLSRVFGMAPLTFTPEGIQISLLYYIYSIVFIASLKAAILFGYVMDVTNPSRSFRTATSHLILLAYQLVLTAVTLVGCLEAPRRCRSMLDTLTRIEKMRYFLDGIKSDAFEVISIYATIFSLLSAVIILSIIDWYKGFYAVYQDNMTASSCIFSLFYVEYIIELLLQFQFIVVMIRLTIILKVVNYRLSNLLQVNDKNRRNRKPLINNLTLSSNDIFLNTDLMKVSEEQSSEEIRVLWLVYESVCDLVREVDRGYGLILLLLLQSFFLHFILTPYYMINLYQVPTGVASVAQQVAWIHFHAANVVIIVEPCHRVKLQIAKTRSLVSELMCQTRCSRLSQCVTAFFKSLTLYQPLVAPLGMCVLERPLLMTILGFMSAYLVPRNYPSIPNTKQMIITNITNKL